MIKKYFQELAKLYSESCCGENESSNGSPEQSRIRLYIQSSFDDIMLALKESNEPTALMICDQLKDAIRQYFNH